MSIMVFAYLEWLRRLALALCELRYDAYFVAPWTRGLPVAPCRAWDDCPSRYPHRFVAMVLDARGLCPSCSRKAGPVDRAVKPVEQLELDGL